MVNIENPSFSLGAPSNAHCPFCDTPIYPIKLTDNLRYCTKCGRASLYRNGEWEKDPEKLSQYFDSLSMPETIETILKLRAENDPEYQRKKENLEKARESLNQLSSTRRRRALNEAKKELENYFKEKEKELQEKTDKDYKDESLTLNEFLTWEYGMIAPDFHKTIRTGKIPGLQRKKLEAAQKVGPDPSKIQKFREKIANIGDNFYIYMYGAWFANAIRIMTENPIGETHKVPEAIIGPIPIYNIQNIERTMSDRKVKYRAIGDVFLAHQHGSKDSLRIDGRLTGPMRYLTLMFLLQLQKEGETKASRMNIGDMDLSGNASVISEIKQEDISYEWHKTFPIITQFSILFDMFLQTIEWHRSLEAGREVIEFELLFRKWLPTSAVQAFDNKKDKILLQGKETSRWVKQALDSLWRGYQMFGEIFPFLSNHVDPMSQKMIDRQAISNINMLPNSYNMKKINMENILGW